MRDPQSLVCSSILAACVACVSGCISFASPEVELRPVSVSASPGALECALAQVLRLGYVVEAAEEGVFFKASRTQNVGSFDVLHAAEAESTLTVVASRERSSEDGRYSHEPSRSATADAVAITDACGIGGHAPGK